INKYKSLPAVTSSKANAPNQVQFEVSRFVEDLNHSGLKYKPEFITRFVASLLTKPFVLLTGLAGSGKTKLAQAFVQWICQNEDQYRIVPVGADWTNREPLLGYPNALDAEKYVHPDSGVLDLILQARENRERPYFLILDEMNLSHVERYFADFLSVMESKAKVSLYDGEDRNGIPKTLEFPNNLFIIGTVNIDETTNMFSPKVLDRANTIEFRVLKEEMKDFLESIKELQVDSLKGLGSGSANSFLDLSTNEKFETKDLNSINEALIDFLGEHTIVGAEFGYRTAREILRLIHQLSVLNGDLNTNQKIDIAIMQKLLPKLHGSRRKLVPVLEKLASFCVAPQDNLVQDVLSNHRFDYSHEDVIYPLTLEKIGRMYRGAIDNGFASFAEA
ncbi:MAG: AAA family ATPase, partial [Bacteroidota bacterium]|nr:AAA family ATPase [Bacteroidota bacterium]